MLVGTDGAGTGVLVGEGNPVGTARGSGDPALSSWAAPREFWTQLELVRGVAIAPEEPAGNEQGDGGKGRSTPPG